MAGLVFPILSSALTFWILLQGTRKSVARHYPIFFSYLGFTLVSNAVLSWFYQYAKSEYLGFYWGFQFLSLALGFGVIWETYGLIFRDFPGSSRMARFLVTFALAAVFVSAILMVSFWEPANIHRVTEIEKSFRMVQAILLALSWVLVLYYEIPLGPNVSGIVFGFGFYVISSVIILSIRASVPPEYFDFWRFSQPVAFLLTKIGWLYALRSYQPAPSAVIPRAMELDYPFTDRDTSLALARVKGSLGRALQP